MLAKVIFKIQRIIFYILLLALCLELIIIFPESIFSPDDPALKPDLEKVEKGVDQVLQNVRLVESSDAKSEWSLNSTRATRTTADGQWSLQNVQVQFYASDGAFYKGFGDEGFVQPDAKDVDLQKNVRLTTSNGYIFKSNKLNYKAGLKKAYVPGNVTVHVDPKAPKNAKIGDLSIVGQDMIADFTTNEIELTKSVRTTRTLPNGQILVIRAERMKMSGKTQDVSFFGKVVIDVGEMRLTGPQAKFNYNSQTQELQALEVTGGAGLTDRVKTATASKVYFSFEKDEITFTGGPRVVQGADEILGDEIVISRKTGRVRVVNARAKMDKEGLNDINSRSKKPR